MAASSLPFVAILRGITPDEILEHAQVLVGHGFTAIEVPTNSPDWANSVARLAATYGKQLLVGAGTVLRQHQVNELVATGAKLMVTPNTDPALVSYAKKHGLHTVIGAMTPTEALAAVVAGADALKIFPASVVGPRFARILTAVLPQAVPLYAVGGITPSVLPDYANLGWAGYGLGGELYRPKQSPAETDARAAAYRRAWEELKP